ncbi:MAG TPA: nucleoside deaminase, partial [Acidimicrobiales bacterium]|nr:nucleoside deaminase [Acidimicrobiales bacterium]
MDDARAFFESEPIWEAAFHQAWDSWRSGSLGIGSVVADAEGRIVARGRNRVLERAGSGRIAGTLLAHAEMNALADLDLATGEGLCVYTTVEPCIMCLATMVAVRVPRVRYAAKDPVFDGLAGALAAHPFCVDRIPETTALGVPVLCSVAALWPMASRVWARPGHPPRAEWLGSNGPIWDA